MEQRTRHLVQALLIVATSRLTAQMALEPHQNQSEFAKINDGCILRICTTKTVWQI